MRNVFEKRDALCTHERAGIPFELCIGVFEEYVFIVFPFVVLVLALAVKGTKQTDAILPRSSEAYRTNLQQTNEWVNLNAFFKHLVLPLLPRLNLKHMFFDAQYMLRENRLILSRFWGIFHTMKL